jgi:hypothetical protein
MPFAYVHFITLLCYVYLPLNAYAAASAVDVNRPIDVTSALLMVILLNFGIGEYEYSMSAADGDTAELWHR